MIVVVDTNVAVVANERDGEFPDCVAACVVRLTEILAAGKIALDQDWLIIKEYMRNLRSSGQPGVGDAFLKWVLTNHANPARCCKVAITSSGRGPNDFQEFPSDHRLSTFDRADCKFVAVALAHAECPPILQALDSEWWEHKDALKDNGVRVTFLCLNEIQELHQRRQRRR